MRVSDQPGALRFALWIPAGGMPARLLFLHHMGEESMHPSKYFSYTIKHYNKSFFFCQSLIFQKYMNKQLRIIFTFNSCFSDFKRNVSDQEVEICRIGMPGLRGLRKNFLDRKEAGKISKEQKERIGGWGKRGWSWWWEMKRLIRSWCGSASKIPEPWAGKFL